MSTKTCRKHFTRLAVLVAAIIAVPLLPGCRSTSTVQTQSASVGQQLQDLEKAYKDGTIDQKQYEKLKKAIVNKNDWDEGQNWHYHEVNRTINGALEEMETRLSPEAK